MSLISGGIWWLADRLWGDRVFSTIRPLIPDWLADPPVGVLVDWIVSFVPPIGLIGLGIYFLYFKARQINQSSVIGPSIQGGDPWRNRPEMELYEIACRSVGKAPVTAINKDPELSQLRLLSNAIEAGRLKSHAILRGDDNHDFRVRITRDDLAAFAKETRNSALSVWVTKEWRSRRPRAPTRPRQPPYRPLLFGVATFVLLVGTILLAYFLSLPRTWSLSESQEQNLREALKSQPNKFPFRIHLVPNAPSDAASFAYRLMSILNSEGHGWGAGVQVIDADYEPHLRGLHVGFRGPATTKTNEKIETLKSMFKKIGVSVTTSHDQRLADDQVLLVVGSRP